MTGGTKVHSYGHKAMSVKPLGDKLSTAHTRCNVRTSLTCGGWDYRAILNWLIGGLNSCPRNGKKNLGWLILFLTRCMPGSKKLEAQSRRWVEPVLDD